MIQQPEELRWIKGKLPEVDEVPEGTWALAWIVYGEEYSVPVPAEGGGFTFEKQSELAGQFKRVVMVYTKGDEMNPVKWCDAAGMPIGHEEEVVQYAWIKHESVDKKKKIKSDFKYHSSHNGFCRVMYSVKNPKNQTVFYLLQNDGPEGINFYRCSRDGEASHGASMPKCGLPLSPGKEQIDREVNDWLLKNGHDWMTAQRNVSEV